MIDEEGFPLVMEARFAPDYEVGYLAADPARCQDQESGETTGQRVIMFRKPPETRPIQSGNEFLRRRLKRTQLETPQHSISHRTLHLHLNFLRSCPSQRQKQPQVPFHTLHNFQPPELQRDLHLEKMVTRKPFRVPLVSTENKSSRKEINISIWKEFCRGQLVYDDGAAKLSKYSFWVPFQVVLGDYAVYVPCCLVWLLRILAVTLKICVPAVGIQVAYYHQLYNHMKIHLAGDERGLDPVFTSIVYQGPLIYSVRYLSCPYCRYTRQSKTVLKYFESLCQERRGMAVG
ncbi:uncharacterized protein LOC121876178 isoform X2 [Homarus americanus]|uniref:uncharacterized protein LOC121876178 isoform X2 n=1 Tax=Homarus americanus TaxID=6706 RepID=UPI001C478F12|nr:uncharacterized protein LOC121876178 isoform X2 [Homarus americanus]